MSTWQRYVFLYMAVLYIFPWAKKQGTGLLKRKSKSGTPGPPCDSYAGVIWTWPKQSFESTGCTLLVVNPIQNPPKYRWFILPLSSLLRFSDFWESPKPSFKPPWAMVQKKRICQWSLNFLQVSAVGQPHPQVENPRVIGKPVKPESDWEIITISVDSFVWWYSHGYLISLGFLSCEKSPIYQ